MPGSRLAVILLLSAALVVPAVAQTVTGTILGLVADPSGAVVPGAAVTATNQSTGFTRTVNTDPEGNYRITFLPLGTYRVEARSAGFERMLRDAIDVQADQRVRVDFALAVGEASQTVEVKAGTPLVETSDATVGDVIDSRRIVELPLNKRNFVDLVQLTAGVTPGRAADYGGETAIDNFRGRFVFSANGQRTTTNNFILDGVDNNANLFNAGGVVIAPVIDSIQEFKVSTANFSPEFGRAAGAVVSVQTKSGTNQLHGAMFEFLRNSDFDANTFFNNRAGQPKPPFRQNQFGFTVGGPIRKDRTFFFGDYQGFRVRDTKNFVSNVPTAAERLGDFSAAGFGTMYDPATAASNGSGGLTLQPFAGNRIPSQRFDPVAQQIVSLYAPPNTNFGALASNFVNNPALRRTDDQFDIRIDHRINDANNIFGRYSFGDATQLFPNAMLTPQNPFGGGSGKGNLSPLRAQSLALNYIHTFSARFLAETRLGFTRTNYTGLPLGNGNPLLNNINIPNQRYNDTIQTIPTFSVSGLTALGPQGNVPNFSVLNNYQVSQNLNYTLASGHSLKFGGDFFRRQLNNNFTGSPTGAFSFSGTYTTVNAASAARPGNSFADLLLGLPATSNRDILLGGFGRRDVVASWYFQDDWKVSRRLTVNAGIRWDLWTPFVEVHDRQSNFGIATAKLVVAAPGGPLGRTLRNTDWNNLGPRLGLAYDLTGNGKTVLRTGYSISYIEDLSAGRTLMPLNPPFGFSDQTTNSQGIIPARRLRDGFNPPVIPSLTNLSGQFHITDTNYRTEYSQNWSFGIQRQLTNNLAADIAYVGTKGTHLMERTDANEPIPGPGAVAARRPFYAYYPNLSTLDGLMSTANSSYNSLQAKLTRRFSSGLYFLAAYTFGRAIEGSEGVGENAVTATVQTMAQNPQNRRADKALASFDMRHRVVFSYIYEFPFGKGKPWLQTGAASRILGNWRVDGATSLLGGNPIAVQMATSNLNTGTYQRPNRLCDGNLPASQQSVYRFFDTSCFVAPPIYTYGNAGRNILIGPRMYNWDASLQRTFPISETKRFEFRGEYFNVFNTPQFYPPMNLVGNPDFATLTAIRSGSNRQGQLALKFIF
jgi:hypothetical protein